MKVLIQSGFLAMFFIIGTITTTVAFADDGLDAPDHRMTILTVDMEFASIESGPGMVKSLIGLLATFGAGDDFYLSTMDKPEIFYGPYRAGDINFANLDTALDTLINTHLYGSPVDMIGSLSEAYNLLALGSAPKGSTLYLIGEGEIQSDSEYAAKYLDPLSDMFLENDWKIIALTTKTSSLNIVDVLARISTNAGGKSFELNTIGGLKTITDHLMDLNSLGTLIEAGGGNLSFTDTLTTKVNVAPGTQNLSLIFFKSDPSGSLRLNNPVGIEASAGDRTSSKVLETPYAVIWELEDPVPGDWSVDAKGINGSVTSWHLATNKFRLHLNNDDIMPSGEPTNIVAYITDDEVMVLPGADAFMRATVTGPNGNDVIYYLNDDGKEGDVTAGDGYYSTMMPPSEVAGTYKVVLNLGWTGLENTLTESGDFKTQPFPNLAITTLNTNQLYPGQTSVVANILVNVSGEPVAVTPASINIGSSVQGEDAGILELVPRELTQDGRAWMYDVLFTPEKDGITSVIFSLDMSYAGRAHNEVTDSLVLNSIKLPVLPPIPYENNAATSVPIDVVPSAVESSFRIPIGLVSIPVAIIALVLALTLYQRSLTRPFGILGNETSKTLVDFANLKRPMIRKVFTPSVVHGNETGIPELDGITFRFTGDRVEMYSVSVSPTVRVDNQPIVGEVMLKNQTWIGTRGRLFNFISGRNNESSPELTYGDD